ncbi:phosphotransferase [Flexivirga caeni]|uniref:phosphotransferase n=1 Tax=Flexivirga caeni TaxID=2294115 RepID=UPI00131555C3|nr:phosphotransferase [Flexivirga caeni]
MSTNHRLQWAALPVHIRELLADCVGSAVVDFTSATSGYSPALAGVATLADGRSVFIKAASPAQNPDTPDIMRTEADNNLKLKHHRAPAPRLLERIDDGTWVILIFEAIAGHTPGAPWNDHDLSAVLDALDLVRTLPVTTLPAAATVFGTIFGGWNRLRDHDPAWESGLDDANMVWWQPRLDELCSLERASLASIAGDSFVHADIRSDNTLVTEDSSAVFVDWTTCCRGASWLDIASMAASVSLEGGSQPQELLARSRVDISSEDLIAFVTGMSGYFVHASRCPPPPGMPTVRDHQREKGVITTTWLRQLLNG